MSNISISRVVSFTVIPVGKWFVNFPSLTLTAMVTSNVKYIKYHYFSPFRIPSELPTQMSVPGEVQGMSEQAIPQSKVSH